MKRSSLFLFFTLCFLSLSCSDHNSSDQISTREEATWTSIDGRADFAIPAFVAIPQGQGPYPAIVVLHGCGGLLSDGNSENLATHFYDWVEFGRRNKVVMIFPDSFTPRNITEFCGVAPPNDAICSPAYERPKDVADVLLWMSKQNYIDKSRLGLMGFSHGGSTAISSIVDTDFVTLDERSVSNNGVTYQVDGPVEMPAKITFKAAVAFYPGAGFYGYYKEDYLPRLPLLIHAASLDPLYTSGSTDELVQTAEQNGATESSKNNVKLYVYEGASHSFDGSNTGANGVASQLAKERTIEWFRKYLKF